MKRLTRNLSAVLVLLSAVSSIGCSTSGKARQDQSVPTTAVIMARPDVAGEELVRLEQMGVEWMSLTNTERELLIALMGEQKRIKEGYLFESERELIRQVRCGMNVLGQKYPNHKFYYVYAKMRTDISNTKVVFMQFDDESFYEMEIEQDGTLFSVQDNFFSKVASEQYNGILKEELTSTLSPVLGVIVNPEKMYGEDYTEEAVAKLTQDTISSLNVDLVVYVDGRSLPEIQRKNTALIIKRKLEKLNITGNLKVNVLESSPVSVASSLELYDYTLADTDKISKVYEYELTESK